ncbi:hypothetical protein VTN96DRAFT_3431 [Rasamsonia emersonii]
MSTRQRPLKRVYQACEPCRRKKRKCSGEQPVCSHCARLHQSCRYARSGVGSGRLTSPPDRASVASRTEAPPSVEDRLSSLEAKMTAVLESLGQNDHIHPFPPSTRRGASVSPPSTRETVSTTLPWEKVVSIAELYLLYCDCQPLPLFHRATFLASLGQRDPEIIYAVLALAIRFCPPSFFKNTDNVTDLITTYAESARTLVIKRVLEGPVELSTLQCLCLLSLVDFTNGNTHHASIYTSLAMNLAKCANLGSETQRVPNQVAREERRRCFWSICLLRRLHGEDFHLLDLAGEDNVPAWPESTGMPPDICVSDHSGVEARLTRSVKDEGIVAYVIIITEVFSRTARYIKRRGKPNDFPPWSPQSEYSKIISLQMEVETRMPYTHRFKYANLAERSTEDLQSNRDYWGPWFLNQFLYHTILCLLNHPLLLSLSLRNFRSTIPEIFLQHSSDLISSHTTWIIHFIKFFNEKGFKVSDPFLGYSAAVVATIELQLSFTEDSAIRKDKQDRFTLCVNFVRELGKEWPHMARMADKLQDLKGAVSASYLPYAQTQNKSLLIDLSRFWEILDYSSVWFSDTTAGRRLFGPSLYSEPPATAPEVSSTSPLPEPTRLGGSSSSQQPSRDRDPNNNNNIVSSGCAASQSLDTGGIPPTTASMDLVNDEFSILAENFFSQGQDFLRGAEDWFNTGNL